MAKTLLINDLAWLQQKNNLEAFPPASEFSTSLFIYVSTLGEILKGLFLACTHDSIWCEIGYVPWQHRNPKKLGSWKGEMHLHILLFVFIF